MVEIVLRVNGIDKTQANLSRLAGQMRDTTTANRAVATQFASWVGRNYQGEGSLVGGWAPVSASTARRKAKAGKEKILIWSGHLRASILPFSDSQRAGIGTEVIYGKYHDEGTSRMPQRRFIPNEAEALEMGTRVYEFYAQKATQDANQ